MVCLVRIRIRPAGPGDGSIRVGDSTDALDGIFPPVPCMNTVNDKEGMRLATGVIEPQCRQRTALGAGNVGGVQQMQTRQPFMHWYAHHARWIISSIFGVAVALQLQFGDDLERHSAIILISERENEPVVLSRAIRQRLAVQFVQRNGDEARRPRPEQRRRGDASANHQKQTTGRQSRRLQLRVEHRFERALNERERCSGS